MSQEKRINRASVRVVAGDITELDVDGFVFYASQNLKLGTGIGNAITLRGGSAIQEELNQFGEQPIGAAVATGAGKLSVNCIIHAVGPGFQEKDLEQKLRTTCDNALKVAADKGVKRLAIPPMGTGFYGVPDNLSARIMAESIQQFTKQSSQIEDITICVLDSWDIKTFEDAL